jgi:hypothetical protein
MKKLFLFLFALLQFINFSKAQTEQKSPQVTAMAFTPNDQKMVSGYEDGTIKIWNGQGQLLLSTKFEFTAENTSSSQVKIESIAISPDGERIAVEIEPGHYLLDKMGKTLCKLSDNTRNYMSFSHDNSVLYEIEESYGTIYSYDYSGKRLKTLKIVPDFLNSNDKRPYQELVDIALKPDGGILAFYRFEMNEKKKLYDFWIYDFDTNLNIKRKTKIPLNPIIYGTRMSANQSCNNVIVHGWNNTGKNRIFEGFNYKPSTGSVSVNAAITSTDYYYPTPEGVNIIILHINGISIGDKYFEIPNPNRDARFFPTPDYLRAIVDYKGKPLEMHSYEKGKLFEFDDSKIVEDKFLNTPVVIESSAQSMSIPKPQNQTNPQFDYSGLKLLSANSNSDNTIDEIDYDIEWLSSEKYHYWKYNGDGIFDGMGNGTVSLSNVVFTADMSFVLPQGSVAVDNAWVEFIFWRRGAGVNEYSVRVNSIGEVMIGRLVKGVYQNVAKKNLMGINITDKVFDRMEVSTNSKWEITCKLYSKGDKPKELTTDSYTTERGSFGVALNSHDPKFSAARFTHLNLKGTAIATKSFPKTLQTKLTGCVAGDCFDGFGYYIQSPTEEFCGYFVGGVKESIGQLHRVNEGIIYNGFFEAEKPNGYANLYYYTRNLTELGTFKNLIQDGEFTIYLNSTMKTALMKGDKDKENTITAIARKTGCLSGDCVNGNGVFQKENGTRFVGDFVNGALVKGVIFDDKSSVIKFEGLNQSKNLEGVVDVFKPNGEVIHGTLINGVMHGQMLIKTPIRSKTLFVEGKFENGVGVDITVQFRDGRKWVGKQFSATTNWGTGTGTMTYTDGKTKTGRFSEGEFIGE